MFQLRSATTILAAILTITLFYTLFLSSRSPSGPPRPPPPPPPPAAPPKYTIDPAYGGRPYAAGWGSWFHPSSWRGDAKGASKGGRVDRDWNLLYHLGGNGPWVQKIEGVATNEVRPPEGCRVEQVHMLARHAERFPTTNAGRRMQRLVDKLNSTGVSFKEDLAFVRDWRFFVDDPQQQFEKLTSTGPYAGTLQAFTTGAKFRTRYRDIIRHVEKDEGRHIRLWASQSGRVEDTARFFDAGFQGSPAADMSHIEVIPELAERGADTLAPSETCRKYIDDAEEGHALGERKMREWQKLFLRPIAERLSGMIATSSRRNAKKSSSDEEAPLTLTDEDVTSMFEMCAYETTARGKSPWCDVFTLQDWADFEYARDLLHYYRSGPGNKYAAALGAPWLAATSRLLNRLDNARGRFFFAFTHKGDMLPVLTTLGLFHDADALPADRNVAERKWRTSQVVPMGGRVVLERLRCDRESSTTAAQRAKSGGESASAGRMLVGSIKEKAAAAALAAGAARGGGDGGAASETKATATAGVDEDDDSDDTIPPAPPNSARLATTFVRLNINDGIVAIPGCVDGPGLSCSLARFDELVREKLKLAGDFGDVCGLREGMPRKIGFLRQGERKVHKEVAGEKGKVV